MKIKSASEKKKKKITDGDSIVNQLTSIGINLDDIKNGNVYKLTKADLTDMEIKGVESDDENGWYIIVYDVTNADVKIYNTSGVKVDDTQKYCLDDIKNIEV